MIGGLILIIIDIVFTIFGIGGSGRVSGSGFVVSAGAGIILIIVGVILLSV